MYVDDIILIGDDLQEIQDLKYFLHLQFKIKDLGILRYFLGLEVLYQTNGLLNSQRKFTLYLLKDFDCFGYSPVSCPLDSSVKLHASEGELLPNPTHYKKLVGKLNFLSNTRLDIAYSVQHLN